MNNSDSTKIFISLKLIPQWRDGTFFPFVHFQEACYIFLQKDITCFLEVDEREECAVPPLRDQFEGDKDLCAVRIVHGSAVP